MFQRRDSFIVNIFALAIILWAISLFFQTSEAKVLVLCAFSYFYIKRYGLMAFSALSAATIAAMCSKDTSNSMNTATIWFVCALGVFHLLFVVFTGSNK